MSEDLVFALRTTINRLVEDINYRNREYKKLDDEKQSVQRQIVMLKIENKQLSIKLEKIRKENIRLRENKGRLENQIYYLEQNTPVEILSLDELRDYEIKNILMQ